MEDTQVYFEIKKKHLFRFRNKGYKCYVKDVFGRTVRSKSKSTYQDAWEWGYSFVKESRKL